MFITPFALEDARLCLVSFGGDDERPWTAESTLVSGSVMMMVRGSVVLIKGSMLEDCLCERRKQTTREHMMTTTSKRRGTRDWKRVNYLFHRESGTRIVVVGSCCDDR